MLIFWEMTSRIISAFSAYLLDSGYMYGVSLRGCVLVDYNSGIAGFAGYDAPRAVFFDSGRCKAGFVLAVFPLVVDRPTILASWWYGPVGHFEVPQVQFLDKLDVPVVFRDRSAQLRC